MTTIDTTLTPRQQDVLDWVAGYISERGYSPTVREVAHSYGWNIGGAMCHLKALRRKGHLTWQDGQARTMRVTR